MELAGVTVVAEDTEATEVTQAPDATDKTDVTYAADGAGVASGRE